MDQRLREQFERICGAGAVLHEPLQLLTYECDALPHLRRSPALVVLPHTYLFSAVVILIAGVLAAVMMRRRIYNLNLVSVLKTRE